MDIQLVLPKHDAGEGVTTQACFPPLGILSIASHLRALYPTFDIEVIDCELVNGDIENLIGADIVGIHSSFLTHEHAIDIAKHAKQRGATVVLGGPHPSAVPNAILRNRRFVDAIVVGDGELAFADLAAGVDYLKIPNLVFREGENIVQNPVLELSVDEWVPIDFSFVDLTAYWRNWEQNFPEQIYFKPLPFFSQRGCRWRSSVGACVFCSIYDVTVRGVTPSSFWAEVQRLNTEWGSDYARDNSDDRAADRKWLSEACSMRPRGLDVGLRFYCRASSIDAETTQMLREMNTVDVFVGFESGDTRILRQANKGGSREGNIRAANLLHENGINVLGSFILGLPGEDDQSIQATVDLISEVRARAGVRRPSCTIMIPFPGSPAFGMMLTQPDLREKYQNRDLINCEDLRRDWVCRFTQTDYEVLLSVADDLFCSGMVGSRIGFGPGVNRTEPEDIEANPSGLGPDADG